MARVELPSKVSQEDLATIIVKSGRLDIHDVDGGEEPFLYSSGNYGPGYLDIKGACGIDDVFETFTEQSALTLLEQEAKFDFIAGNATGGMIPAFRVKQLIAEWAGKRVPYVYLRNTRKLGGQQEYATGIDRNPNINPDMKPLIYEELVNFAETTSNAAEVWTDILKYNPPTHGGTILEYANPMAAENLARHGLVLVSVIDLPTVLNVAEELKLFPAGAINSYRDFLRNPAQWQAVRGIQKRELS